MKWYFRYPIMIVLGGVGLELGRAARDMSVTRAVIPQTSGDVAEFIAYMFIFFAGAMAGKE